MQSSFIIICLFYAILAIAIKFQLVIYDIKSIFFLYFILDIVQEIIRKFNNFSASQTNQMMMGCVIVFIVQFIPASAVTKVQLLEQFQRCKQFQRTIYSCQTNRRIFFMYDFYTSSALIWFSLLSRNA